MIKFYKKLGSKDGTNSIYSLAEVREKMNNIQVIFWSMNN